MDCSVAECFAHLRHKDHDFFELPTEIFGEEEHAPAFHALLPVEPVEEAHVFESGILAPAANGPLEAVFLDVLEAGIDEALPALVDGVERLAIALRRLRDNLAPLGQDVVGRDCAIV